MKDPFPQVSMLFAVKTGNHKKNNLLHDVHSLQHIVNNLSFTKRKTSFECSKVKQQNIFGLALIDAENLVHSAIVSGVFWDSTWRKISSPNGPLSRDCRWSK